MVKPPCRGCENRRIGCHASCDAYIKYNDELRKLHQERNIRRILNEMAIEQSNQPRNNAMKRMARKMYGDNNDPR